MGIVRIEKGGSILTKCSTAPTTLSSTLTQGYSNLANVPSYESNRHNLAQQWSFPYCSPRRPPKSLSQLELEASEGSFFPLYLPVLIRFFETPKHFMSVIVFIKTLANFNKNLCKLSYAGFWVSEFVTICPTYSSFILKFTYPVSSFFLFTWEFKNDIGKVEMGSYKSQLVKWRCFLKIIQSNSVYREKWGHEM